MVTGDALTDLFREFARTTYRLKARRAYDAEPDGSGERDQASSRLGQNHLRVHR